MKKILIGDSLFEYLGEGESYKNFGMAGDTTNGVLNRLWFVEGIEEAEEIYLLVGVNDLLSGSSVDVLKSTYLNLIENILDLNKNLKVVSLLPVAGNFISPEIINEHVRDFNRFLKNQSNILNLEYIDVHSKLLCGEYLCGQYSTDGVHLNREGKEILKECIGV